MDHNSDHRNQNTDHPLNEERTDLNDVQNIQNFEKGKEENSEKLSSKVENPAEKEADPAKKTEIPGELADEGDLNDSDAFYVVNEEKQAQHSCSYTPPYYVPNMSSQPSGMATPPRKKKHTGWVVFACAAVAVLLLIAMTLVGAAGVLLNILPSLLKNSTGDDTMNVIKNDGSIDVNEQVGSTGYSNLSVPEVVDLVADSVVEITTSHVQTDFFYNSYVTSGAGSGVLFAETDNKQKSYIITNYHVIEGSTKTIVRLKNGKEYEATFVSGDEDTDIAVLTIPVAGLTYATLGSSESLQVGEEVVAIGNPLGELGGTVTNGIISALDRSVIVDNHRMTLLQTNAAINPGNSGGGLFNMAGELIGIVNAKQSDTGIEGLGFAIPIDIAWDVAKDLMEKGYVTGKLQLGFDVVGQPAAFQVQQGYNIYELPAGVYISETTRNDLKIYDRIVSINGKTISDINDYYNAVDVLKKGHNMTIVVSRISTNGSLYSFVNKTVTLTVTVTE